MFDLLDYLSLILIFVFGVPHGAFDASIALTLGYYENLKSKLIFIFLYILLASAVAITWYLFPTFVLIIFLFISILHFGLGDTNWSKSFKCLLSVYVNGGIIIFGISFIHYEEVDLIYRILLNGSNTYYVWTILEYGLIFWLLLLPFHSYINFDEIKKDYIVRISVISIIIYTTNAIFAFSFYFCFIHSFNHIKRILPSLRNNLSDKNIKNMFLFFTVLTWILGFMIFTYLNYYVSLDHSIIKVTFIGLAALTFPHMILVDLYFRPSLKI